MNVPMTGFIYKIVIDPILKSVHTKVQSLIEDNQSVLDVACGTGALSFLIAAKARHVVGIDISPSMINTANTIKQKRKIENVKFIQTDATKKFPFKPKEFDLALISMGLHQFPLTSGCSILREMKRIAAEVIILDYAAPLPDTWGGFITRFFEFLGGREHFTNFKVYIKSSGINFLINEIGLIKSFEKITHNKIFMIIKCQKIKSEQ
jgi:ubiquinone/menaquinone biosynthesis C-methylase UbiE